MNYYSMDDVVRPDLATGMLLRIRLPHVCNKQNTQNASADLQMTPVGFEPTQLALVELESTPLDHSGKVSWRYDARHHV